LIGTYLLSKKFSLFVAQFSIRKVKYPKIGDLFDVKQQSGEPLKDYMTRFYRITVKIPLHQEGDVGECFCEAILSKPI